MMKVSLLLLFLLTGCISETPKLTSINGIVNPPTIISGVPIHATVSGLGTSPVVLSLNDESDLSMSANGTYTFPQNANEDLDFEVKVKKQPDDKKCLVTNPLGKAIAPSQSINVKCVSTSSYLVGGIVSGHSNGTLKLILTGSGAGSKTADVLPGEASYFFNGDISNVTSVTVSAQPELESCFFANGTTTATLAAPYDRLDIWCAPLSIAGNYTINLNVTGLPISTILEVTGSDFGVKTISGTGTSLTTTVSTSSAIGQRSIMEITGVPSLYRCYFNNTKNHLYSETKTDADTRVVQVTCTARSVCESIGLELPATNGKLNDVSCSKDRIVYGGNFSQVGRQFGLTKLIKASGGVPTPHKNVYDRIHGKVNKIISDGKSGFFVAGSFSRVGDKNKKNLVRLNSDLIIDESFDTGSDGEILDLILDNNQLYVFGHFQNLIKDNTPISRKGFGKINLTSSPEEVSSLQLPDNMSIHPSAFISSSIIGSFIYFHSNLLVDASSQKLLILMNKNTGKLKTLTTYAAEKGNTIFWTEPRTGIVWMINSDIGMVSTDNLSAHSNELASPHAYIKLDRTYTLSNNNLLYQSDGTQIQVVNLGNMFDHTATLSSYGKNTAGSDVSVQNAGKGFTVDSDTCFYQAEGSDFIKLGSATPPADDLRYGYVCFNPNGAPTVTGYPYASYPNSSVVHGDSIIMNTPFYAHQPTQSLAVIKETAQPYPWTSLLSKTDEVFTLDSSSVYTYIGGSFASYGTCTKCSKLMRIQTNDPSASSAPTIDTTWLLTTPFTYSVKKLSVSDDYLVAITEDPTKNFISMQPAAQNSYKKIGLPTAPVDILNIGAAIISREGTMVTYRNHANFEYNIPSALEQVSVPIARITSQFVLPIESPNIFIRASDGTPHNDFATSSYDLASLRITGVLNTFCLYDGGTGLSCMDTNALNRLSPATIFKDNYSVFKGVGNALFVGKEYSAPVTFVPTPSP
jgi:hypothetical protein